MKNLQLSAIFLSLFFLIGCGPSEEEIRQEQQASILYWWNDSVNTYKEYQEDEELKVITEGISDFYITDDGRGIIFRESNFEMIGFVGLSFFSPTLRIPDFIFEQISNTAPIDGNQKAQYDNVEINWSVGRRGDPDGLGSMFDTVSIYISLRLID